MTRQCSRCLIEYPLESGFYKNSFNAEGMSTICKECQKKASRIYHHTHKESVKRRKKAYRTLHRDEEKIKRKIYREKNKEKIKERRSSEEHIKKVREYNRRYRINNPEKIKEASSRRSQRIKNSPASERISKIAIFLRDKGICQICHEPVDAYDASFDHVVPLSQGGEHSNRNIVLTHLRCNIHKGTKAIPQQQRLLP